MESVDGGVLWDWVRGGEVVKHVLRAGRVAHYDDFGFGAFELADVVNALGEVFDVPVQAVDAPALVGGCEEDVKDAPCVVGGGGEGGGEDWDVGDCEEAVG